MRLSTSFDNSLEESNSYLEFKYPQDTRFRLRTTDWKISDQDLTDAGSSNANLEHKFGNVKKCHKISGENSYLYSKAAKSYFDEPREKLSSRPLCGRDKTISRSSKDFVAKVYTTFCVQPENL
jgi:hypothetical protein